MFKRYLSIVYSVEFEYATKRFWGKAFIKDVFYSLDRTAFTYI